MPCCQCLKGRPNNVGRTLLSEPMEFGGEMSGMSVMCRTVPMKCKFPFIYNGVTYHDCTKAPVPSNTTTAEDSSEAASDEDSFFWCATQTDDLDNMLPDSWGMCDLDSCEEGEPVFNNNAF